MYQWKLRASDDRSSTSTDDQVVIRIVQSEIDFAHETPDVRGKIGEFLVGHHSEIGGMAQRHQHMWNGEIAANGTKLTKWWLR